MSKSESSYRFPSNSVRERQAQLEFGNIIIDLLLRHDAAGELWLNVTSVIVNAC